MTPTGALIMAFFATVWWIVGLRTAGHGAAWVYAVPVCVAAMLGVAFIARRRSDNPMQAIDEAEESRR
jgi:hypothetical protein